MSDTSPVLALPYIKPSQAQKHVTHNEALRVLDALVQLSVLRADLATPPATPAPGARYLVAGTATGAWEGMETHVAIWDEAWIFHAPRPGWCAYVEETGRFVVWDGAAWRDPSDSFETLDRLGLNAAPDATNRLALSSPASLFSHEGAGHQIKVNKAGATDTASLLFQTDWSGRAEMGTMGDDAFGIKVSADGSLWTEALTVDPATGRPVLPQGAEIEGAEINGEVSGTAVQATATDDTAGKLLPVGAFGLGKLVSVTDDMDNDRPPGLYYGQGAANRYDATNGYVFQMTADENFAMQIYIPAGGVATKFGVRRKRAGAWDGWLNILSESGANANGAFVRLPDGTLICTHAVATSAVADTVWTFPAAFASAPPGLSFIPAGHAVRSSAVASATTTTVSFNVYNSSDARVSSFTRLLAVGRWF